MKLTREKEFKIFILNIKWNLFSFVLEKMAQMCLQSVFSTITVFNQLSSSGSSNLEKIKSNKPNWLIKII